MILFLLALIGLGFLLYWQSTRPYALLGIGAVVVALLWDAWITEAPMDRESYEVRSMEVTPPPAGGAYRTLVRIKNKDKNATLENANIELVVKDCVEEVCRVIGRQTKEWQFLAGPGQVKEQTVWYYFNNMVETKGTIKTDIKILDVTGDW